MRSINDINCTNDSICAKCFNDPNHQLVD